MRTKRNLDCTLFSVRSPLSSRQFRVAPMATSPIPIHEPPSNHPQIDRLSNLPDELLATILSFLPIRMAARTSVLCRRFRRLCEVAWETSPFLELISSDFPHRKTSAARFATMAKRTLLRRSPSHPLHSLRIELDRYLFFRSRGDESSFLPSLFAKARSLGVRHLTLEGRRSSPFCPTLPFIFSINSLESLSLPQVGRTYFPSSVTRHWDEYSVFPSAVILTNLKSLSIQRYGADSANLNLFLSQLRSLEVLSIGLATHDTFSLSSQTISKLKLIICISRTTRNTIELALPSLQFLHVQNDGMLVPHIRGDMPSLRKAVLNLSYLREEDWSAVAGLMKSVAHAKELILRIKERDVICSAPSFCNIFFSQNLFDSFSICTNWNYVISDERVSN